MRYTEIPDKIQEEFNERMRDPAPFKPNWAKIKTLSKEDASIFTKWYLGMAPFVYQDMMLNGEQSRIVICSSRQIGKTYAVAFKALHFAMYNPKTTVLVYSRNLSQSKKFIKVMRNLMYEGMQNVKKLVDNSRTQYINEEPVFIFPQNIDNKKPNNTSEFSLLNGSTIMSLPATDSSRGFTADLVIVDEAAFVSDEIFEMVIEPTVRFTGGSIILLSTPNGQKGYFYDLFDPFEKKAEHEYTRYWWPWELCPNEKIREMTEKKRKSMDPMRFQQEYEARFTTDANAFFVPRKVKEATIESMEKVYSDLKNQYICGIDYGVTKSKTVVSLCYLNENDGNVYLVYQKTFPGGYDNAQLPRFLNTLETQFNITKYVVDDCPQGDSATQQLEREGKAVRRVYFGKEKIGMYFRFKTALNKRDDDDDGKGHRFRMPLIEDLKKEMMALQIRDSRTRVTYIIEKPQGGSDDRIDSLVLATLPFLEEEEREFRSYLA